MSISSIGVKIGSPKLKIESFNRFLFIGPHPDDIEIGAGATVKKLVEAGKEVAFLICTDGRYGDGNMPEGFKREDVIKTRRQEVLDSAKFLGVKSVSFLNLSDGGFYDMKELEKGIAKVVEEINPDIIFAPDHRSTSENHKDHLNVGTAASTIACFAPYEGIMNRYGCISSNVKGIAYYFTAHPNTYVRTGNRLKIQLKAIELHASQFPKGSGEFGSIKTYLTLRSIDFGLRRFCFAAEGFRVLSAQQMHCLPESGF